ncbi:alpha/beta fold hydrolase [Mycobacterium sp. 050134]|uniref:alpha/beta fold hydrolase n=1 Tax=Mycobacterium sp. 050134 TaxID=3096111 RepID=UPI002ED8B207
MDLFFRESGSARAPAIVFLHGGEYSGRSWQPVVERLRERYRCLVPDLPQHGNSLQPEPFEMKGAATAVAELIRARVGGRAHLVGLSLGAQVGAQLLAANPELIDRAVLCGAIVNELPGVRFAQLVMGVVARVSRSVTLRKNARLIGVSPARRDDYRDDIRLMPAEQVAHVVEAVTGFTLPDGLDKSDSPALFLSGSHDMWLVRRSAAALARKMPNGIDRIATGMDHEWPLHNPDLFSRTVDGWLSNSALPPEIALTDSIRR